MQSFDDDPNSGGSQDGSSDDEQERLDQVNDAEDPEQEPEPEAEDEGEGDDYDEEDGDGDDGGDEGADDDLQAPGEPLTGPLLPGPTVSLTAASPRVDTEDARPPGGRIDVRPEALTANSYDIVPTIAAPHSTSINVVAATPDLRWVFSGGSDGYIRRFNWVDTANSKLMLTVAQRHPFVDSVTKAGVLVSYWENEDPQPRDENSALSPVYSLAVHHQALWLLSGLESGGINLQSVRHDEGKRIHCLRKHTSAVSVLNLAPDERSVLSGSWDKTVLDWDLDTGQVKRSFIGSGGQISVIEMRPQSSVPVPETAPALPLTNGTLSSNNADAPRPGAGDAGPAGGDLSNGVTDGVGAADAGELDDGGVGPAGAALSPVDSLFGGGESDDLFGESAADAGGQGDLELNDDDNDNEFSRAIARDIREGEPAADISMLDAPTDAEINGVAESSSDMVASSIIQAVPGAPVTASTTAPAASVALIAVESSLPETAAALPNGLPHAEDTEMAEAGGTQNETATPGSETTFLAASIDGSLRIWDKRAAGPVAEILPRNTPPWCMGACWSPDGNSIYAGRRNGTVDEYSLLHGLRAPERVFRFPNGSGPVSAVRAMPNGRHLVCASHDILRLYDVRHQPAPASRGAASVPFLIVPGHRTGVVSQLYLDHSCRFMMSSAGTRGWEGTSTQVLLGYEINIDG